MKIYFKVWRCIPFGSNREGICLTISMHAQAKLCPEIQVLGKLKLLPRNIEALEGKRATQPVFGTNCDDENKFEIYGKILSSSSSLSYLKSFGSLRFD